jgi:hypothetical protein
MVEQVRQRLGLTSLKYQRLPDLVSAIGLPKQMLCTYCWDGAEPCGRCPARAAAKATAKAAALVGAGASSGGVLSPGTAARAASVKRPGHGKPR